MTHEEAIEYIERYTWSTTRLGLDRTRELLHGLKDPQKELRFIHVAGSNGKGSTCAMLDAILRAAGYRVGLYTSPYIEDFCERIQVDGENIPGNRLAEIAERVKAIADAMEDHPSQFELVTAAAMEYFRERGCDIVVLEVGMGGELDSTNVIDAPETAVITNIGLEHTEYLGNTLTEIASAKAGIIKPGCSCVCYDGEKEVSDVIRDTCEARGVPLAFADFAALEPIGQTLDGQSFRYRGTEHRVALLGRHQLYNAAVVLETVAVLRQRGWTIGDAAVAEGLSHVQWPARLEVLGRKPLFLLDGGHNPQCAEALSQSAAGLLGGRRAVFVMGVLADKDYARILDIVEPLASRFICLTPASPRALPGRELAAFLTSRGARAEEAEDIPTGLAAALDAAGEDGAVITFGSLYLAGAVRTAFPAVYKKYIRACVLAARSRMTPMRCGFLSDRVVKRILQSPELQRAKTVMLYRAMRGEVRLQALESALGQEKRLVYPRVEGGGLAAYTSAEGAWLSGAFGVEEPDPERGERVEPGDIDLVICPCTAFDESGVRLGMGGGYYDRFLPLCENATVAAAAFEYQKRERLPRDDWDRPMDLVFTENDVYHMRKHSE